MDEKWVDRMLSMTAEDFEFEKKLVFEILRRTEEARRPKRTARMIFAASCDKVEGQILKARKPKA